MDDTVGPAGTAGRRGHLGQMALPGVRHLVTMTSGSKITAPATKAKDVNETSPGSPEIFATMSVGAGNHRPTACFGVLLHPPEATCPQLSLLFFLCRFHMRRSPRIHIYSPVLISTLGLLSLKTLPRKPRPRDKSVCLLLVWQLGAFWAPRSIPQGGKMKERREEREVRFGGSLPSA